MLVLTRKIGEAIQFGDNVTVEVLEVRGGRVRLGITAPSDVGIQRREIIVAASELTTPSRPAAPASQRQRQAVSVG